MKLTKRILCLALGVLFAFTVAQVAFVGAAATEPDRTTYPTVYVAGGWHELINTETGVTAFDPNDALLTDKDTMDMIMAAVTTLDMDKLADALIQMFNKPYSACAMGCDGESLYPVDGTLKLYLPEHIDDFIAWLIAIAGDPDDFLAGLLFLPGVDPKMGTLEGLLAIDEALAGLAALGLIPPTSLIEILAMSKDLFKTFPDDYRHERHRGKLFYDVAGIGEGVWFKDGDAYYSNDWRLSPQKNAELLKEFIDDLVLPFTEGGVEEGKVNIAFVSGSGPLGLCFLAEQDLTNINGVTFNMPFSNGSSMFGGIATRQFGFSAAALGNTGPMYCWGLNETVGPLVPVIRTLYEAGAVDLLIKLLNNMASDAYHRLYEQALIATWFHMPFYWALIPAEYYTQAKFALFPSHAELQAHAGLFAKTDAYFEIQKKSTQIMQAAAEKIKIGIFVGYGWPLSPYSQLSNESSDELVDAKYASFGAICAEPNNPFMPWYKQAQAVEGVGPAGYSYVSPDRMVDASTCALPDYTWFSKDYPHMPDIRVDEWVDWFLNAPAGYDSVHASKTYPQWMQFVSYGVHKPYDFQATIWSNIFDVLLAAVLWIAKIWRWFLMAPLFWL